jgi:hypothetical protein
MLCVLIGIVLVFFPFDCCHPSAALSLFVLVNLRVKTASFFSSVQKSFSVKRPVICDVMPYTCVTLLDCHSSNKLFSVYAP